MLPTILFTGAWSQQDIHLELLQESTREKIDGAESMIDSLWLEEEKKAASMNAPLYNEVGLRLDSYTEDNGALRLCFSPIDFKTRRGLKKYVEKFGLIPQSAFPMGCATGALLTTSDGYFIFGKRAYAHAHPVDLIGGSVQFPVEEISNTMLHTECLREIHEETGIPHASMISAILNGALLSQGMSVLFVFSIAVNCTKNEVLHFFETRMENEMQELCFIPREEIQSYLSSFPTYHRLLPSFLSYESYFRHWK